MRNDSKNLISALALLGLFFVLPESRPAISDTGNRLVLLLLAACGILMSRILILSSKTLDRTGIEPSILSFMATWGCGIPIYPVVAVFAGAGSLMNSIRSGKPLRASATAAVFQGISFAVLLRLAETLYGSISGALQLSGAVGTYLALAGASVVITLCRTALVLFTADTGTSFFKRAGGNLYANGFILLLAVPGTITVTTSPNTIELLVTLTLSLFAMLIVHGISLALNRSAHERTGEMETVLSLREFSQELFAAGNEEHVLRSLCRALSEAWKCRSAVRWRNLTYCLGEPWDYESGISFVHPHGLSVMVDSLSPTVPMYLEAFAERTFPVLTGLEAEKRMEKTSWNSVETMVSLMEENESEFAGFGRKVARTAERLSGLLQRGSWYGDCVRLAGLLHSIELEGDPENGEGSLLSLPAVTTEALRHFREHWCGTGPAGLSGEGIPLSARILAVSIGWERALLSGREAAVRDLSMKKGTMYDPALVDLLLED